MPPTAVTAETSFRPGIVIFVAVLNFLCAAASLFVSFVLGAALLLGNLFGLRQYAADHAAAAAPQINWPAVLNVTFGFLTISAFVMGFAYILLAIGQLRGR